ncbi:MAG TPA: XdhC family protein [Drouetiella sp.]
MSEIRDILSLYERVAKGNSRHAFATVISTEGPSYRSAGARSLIVEDGTFRGGLSAGCLEGDVACRLDGEQKPFTVEYDLSTEDDIRGFPFGCGGTVSIFVEPLPDANALQAVQWLSSLMEPAVLLTVVQSAHPDYPSGFRCGQSLSSTLSFGAELSLEFDSIMESTFVSRKSRLQNVEHEGQTIQLFAEYFEPAINLAIFGDGEDSIALAALAETVGLDVCRVSKHELRTDKTLLLTYPSLERSYNVIMTHDLVLDTEALKILAPIVPPYVGVMGPRTRTEKMLNNIGLNAIETLRQPHFYSPIGLNMAAETPNEIALSILAEIQTVARGREPKHLRDMSGAIHDRASNIAQVRNQVCLKTARTAEVEKVVGA